MLAPALSSTFSRPIGQFSSFYQQTQSVQYGARLASSETPRQGGYDGFKVFDQLLQRGSEALQTSSRYVRAAPEAGPSPNQVAERILGFIERRLQRDLAEGAGTEALAGRLEAGLEGFVKGFEDAREQLEGLGLLNKAVVAQTDATYERVVSGVDALRERFLETGATPAPVVDEAAAPAAPLGALNGFSQYGYAQRNSLSFELQTADGDTVRIQAGAEELLAARAQAAGFLDAGRALVGQSGSAGYSYSQQFNLRVDGDLDAGELAAINDLLAKVNDLSGQFFQGDLEGAFNSALSIGYDSREITGFALNLTRVEVVRATAAYQQFEGPGVYAGPAPLNDLAPLGDFARDLIGALELASPFAQPNQLLRDLADRVGSLDDGRAAADGKAFGAFVERLLESL
ncbi:hypothetical protein FKG94_09815 [Exilibacterium tricleocarpae]|uniref:DUF5610 domain-containing protein n=1 Tax=Exilibacterium tricleocarpae TaxID=2591008 RepID=A0A545TUT2_9GAMM|nr:DUF5610 domain-containing protein [Exilibacterium tricleocarpae]TQV80983.1 hypothetical protein FKG94_09815 [Exilibacterium tricleocarpae]